MKYYLPEISWHNRDPVLSVDFQLNSNPKEPLRLASGGTNSHVLIWHITKLDTETVNLDVAADLTRHQKAVNVVRWSPNGIFLASGDDESIIFIWKQRNDKDPVPTSDQLDEQYRETWIIHKTLRGHVEDILDISWNPDSLHIASGSVNNKLLLWDVARGRHTLLGDHKGFVQGVSWDPLAKFIATCSTDRFFRTFDVSTKKVVSRSSKAIMPFPSNHPLHEVKVRLYHDDTLQTFFRRLHFSPDGLLIAVPAGKIEPEHAGKIDTKPINAVYIYTRYSLKVPACVLPCGESAALAVRWSPVAYKARPQGPPSAFPLPHRFVLAIATRRSLLLYDTQQKTPIALVNNVHYTRLTDLTWSPDGTILLASSTDGFCSIVTFNGGELGEVIPHDQIVSPRIQPSEEKPQTNTEQNKPESEVTIKNRIFNKFIIPTEKSTMMDKIDDKVKTPVKMDVMEETAMPSWSDNSNNEIIKPNKDVIVIDDDSDDIKLVYEDTEGLNKSADDMVSATEPQISKQKEITKVAGTDTSFFKQAKITDVSQPAKNTNVTTGSDTKRRVSFITLSSPKDSKKKK